MGACSECGACYDCKTWDSDDCECCPNHGEQDDCRECDNCECHEPPEKWTCKHKSQEDEPHCNDCCDDIHDDEEEEEEEGVDNDYLDTAFDDAPKEPSDQLKRIEKKVADWVAEKSSSRWVQPTRPGGLCGTNRGHTGKECIHPGGSDTPYRPDIGNVIHHKQALQDGTTYERTFVSVNRTEAFNLSCSLHDIDD